MYYNADPKIREIYTAHNFKTVPYLTVSQNQVKRDPNVANFYDAPDIWLIKKEEASDSQMLLKFVNNRLGNDLPLKVPFHVVLVNTIVMLVGLIGMVALVFKIRNALIQPSLWFFIAMASYVICLSGVVYSISHQNPFFLF